MSLPTWKDNIGYEEGQERVINRMTTGYPRYDSFDFVVFSTLIHFVTISFFIHKLIVAFADDIVRKHGHPGQQAMLFPSSRTARRCLSFMSSREPDLCASQVEVIDLVLDCSRASAEKFAKLYPSVSAVLFPKELFQIAKQYWQHTGDGISSRRAEFCHGLFQEKALVAQTTLQSNGFRNACKGPRRYQRESIGKSSPTSHKFDTVASVQQPSRMDSSAEAHESTQFLEERFGRNLDVFFFDNAKLAIRRRIAGSLMSEVDLAAEPSPKTTWNMRGIVDLSEDDVYLFPCGMNSIFHTHQMMLKARDPKKSISFGFPYVDTLKILEKFGPGVLFYGNGSSEDLDDLERRLKAGERYLALFCEFPGNPILKCPDLKRIRKLADEFDFAVIIDETIGNFINVNVLLYADVVVSSLTKIFSGECNVMGGSAIFNPKGRYYHALKRIAATDFEDNYWAEDVIFMERNSRHFISRIERINNNAEVICNILQAHPLIKTVYYPRHNPLYEACRTQNGGYGGLLSFEFKTTAQAIAFYDRIETAKGPSLGTNFTLISPYVILAHFLELDWAAQFGIPADLIRISVGLEDAEDLKTRFAVALKAAEQVGS